MLVRIKAGPREAFDAPRWLNRGTGNLERPGLPLELEYVAQMVKRLPAVQETQVRSLSWEDPLEKEMETHSSTFDWKIPQTERILRAW